jgi:hypothetical protein
MAEKNNLEIKITADPGAAEQSLKKVAEGITRTGKAAKDSGGFVDGLTSQFGVFDMTLAGVASNILNKGISALVSLGKQALTEANNFKKFGETVDLSAQEVTGIARTAEQSGASFESLQMAFQGINKALDPTQISENRVALEKLGVSVKNADGTLVSQKELLLRAADAFSKETDSAKKASIGMAAFGRASKDMTVMLNQGRDALEKQFDSYGKASGYTDDFAATIEKLNGVITDAKAGALAFATVITDNFIFEQAIACLGDLTKAFLEWRKASADKNEAKKTEDIGKLTEAYAEYYKAREKGEDVTKAEEKQSKILLNLERPVISSLENTKAQVEGLKQAFKDLKKEGIDTSGLNFDWKIATGVVESIEGEAKAKKKLTKAQQEAAEREAEAERKRKEAEAAAKRAAEERYSSLKKLSEQLVANYGTEEDALARSRDKDLAELKTLIDKKMVSLDVYDDAVKKRNQKYEDDIANLHEKEAQKTKAFFDGIEQREKNAQEQMLRIRESCAKTDAERDRIAIDRIKQKYAEELKMAEETKVAKTDIEKAMNAEIEAINNGAKEREKAKKNEMAEYERQLRETATESEEGRLAIQRERMNAMYDEQVEKARNNAALINQINKARAAEDERIERQLMQVRLSTAEAYATSMMQVVKGAAVLGKAGGNTMKVIAISEATINTALAATKAMTAAPWPLNLALAAGATASGMAQVATIQRQKFADGGIVGGNSYYGDHVPVQANSGELILNKKQQKELFKIANGKTEDGERIIVNFSPQIAPSINSEDVKKMLRENQSLFRSFLANEVSKGLSSARTFA